MSTLARPVSSALARAVLAFTCFLVLFAIAAASASAAPWSAPEAVSAPGGGATGSRVGIDAAGNATAVWTQSDGTHSIARAAERPVGGSWSTPVDLSGSVGDAEIPTVAVDPAGDVIVAWKERTSGSEAIEVSYKPAGGSWEGPAAVEFGSAVVETPAVAIDDTGDAVVIWRQEVGGNHMIFAVSLSGGAWEAPTAISISALDAEAPDLAMSPSGTAAAVWQSSSGATSVVESSALPLGGSWSAAEAISPPATVTEPPQVVADATGGFAAIWSRSGVGLVAEVTSRFAVGPWSAPEPISTPGLEAHAPQLAVDSAGDAVAAWYRFDGSVGSVEATELTAGGPWTPPVRVSPVGAEAEAPQVAMSPAGAALAVWSGWDESTHNYATRSSRLLANGTWQASKLVSLEDEEAYGPHVSIDQSGHSVIVWNGEVSLGPEIRSSYRDETTPLLVTKAGAGSGAVTSLSAGIDCGATCTARFPEEGTVTLTAAAAAGSSFAGWSGACSGTGSCAVAIGEAQSSVGAEFVPVPSGGGEAGGSGGGNVPVADVPVPDGHDAGASTPTPTPTPSPPACTAVSPVPTVGTFVPPTAKPGRLVPGIRAQVSVEVPSAVRVTGTLIYGAGKSRRIDLGTLGYHGTGVRNLRFVLPAAVRAELPLETTVWASLAVVAIPDTAQGCATPGAVTHQMKVKVARVLSAPQAGVN